MDARELYILAAFHGIEMSRMMRAYRIEERSGIYSGFWREVVGDTFFNLSTVPGYAYWEGVKATYPAEVREVGDAIIREARVASPRGQACFVEGWQERISTVVEQANQPPTR